MDNTKTHCDRCGRHFLGSEPFADCNGSFCSVECRARATLDNLLAEAAHEAGTKAAQDAYTAAHADYMRDAAGGKL